MKIKNIKKRKGFFKKKEKKGKEGPKELYFPRRLKKSFFKKCYKKS